MSQGHKAVKTEGDTGFYKPCQEQIKNPESTKCQCPPWAIAPSLLV